MLPRALLGLALFVALFTSSHAGAGEEPKVVREAKLRALVARVERRHEAHRTFRARFVQLVKFVAHDEAIVRRGAVAFRRPGKLSFRYDDGDWVVADGKRLRAYVKAHQRVYVMKAKRSLHPAILAFLEKKGSLTAGFRLRIIETKDARARGGVILEAVPKQASPTFERMLLFIDDETGAVRRVLVVDAQGNTNRFVFDDVVVGKPIDDGVFRSPKTPKGAKVVVP